MDEDDSAAFQDKRAAVSGDGLTIEAFSLYLTDRIAREGRATRVHSAVATLPCAAAVRACKIAQSGQLASHSAPE